MERNIYLSCPKLTNREFLDIHLYYLANIQKEQSARVSVLLAIYVKVTLKVKTISLKKEIIKICIEIGEKPGENRTVQV